MSNLIVEVHTWSNQYKEQIRRHPMLQDIFNDSGLNAPCGLPAEEFKSLVLAFLHGFARSREVTLLKLGKVRDVNGWFSLAVVPYKHGQVSQVLICHAKFTWHGKGQKTVREAWMRIWYKA